MVKVSRLSEIIYFTVILKKIIGFSVLLIGGNIIATLFFEDNKLQTH
jgi:hypothetical protein